MGIATNFFGALGIDVIGHGIWDSITKEVSSKGGKAISSFVFGIGLADEVCFAKAATYAVGKLNVPVVQIVRIIGIINSYPIGVRKRIVQFIGYSEEDIPQEPKVSESEKEAGKKSSGKGEKKSEKVKPIVGNDNIAGANIIKMLSDMTDEEIRAFFTSVGMEETFGKKARRAYDSGREVYNTPEVQRVKEIVTDKFHEVSDDYHDALEKKTVIESVGDCWPFNKLKLFK